MNVKNCEKEKEMENFVKNFNQFLKNKAELESIEQTDGKDSLKREKRKEAKEKREKINIISSIQSLGDKNTTGEKENEEKEEEKKKRKIYKKKKRKDEEREKITASKFFLEFTKSEELQGLLFDFVEMRRQLKKPLTPISLKYNLRKLTKLSQDTQEQILIVLQTLENGWLSFHETFEVQNYRKKGKNQSSEFSFRVE